MAWLPDGIKGQHRYIEFYSPQLILIGSSVQRLLRPIVASDWERSRIYAHRFPEIILRSSWTVVIPDTSRTEHVFTRGLPLSQCLRPLLVQSSRRRLPLHRYISDSCNHTHFVLALLGFPFFHPLNAPA
jgi:hypothetical protein